MQAHIKEIVEGVGLGALKFGLSKDKVKFVLGNPDETETYSYGEDEEGETTEAWHYDELELSIAFDEEEDWRLTVISINAADYVFKGFSPVGLSKEELKEKLGALEITDLEFEDFATDDSPSHELISSESLAISFWFDNNIVSEVQWGPHILDDDTVKWPALDSGT
jgi:hypothetical protein